MRDHTNRENKTNGEADGDNPGARPPQSRPVEDSRGKGRSASALLREIRREVKRAIG